MGSSLKKDFWDLTNRPHTKLKLRILNTYLDAWLSIIAKRASENPTWKRWQTIYYIDCFAGKGKYSCDGIEDCVDGSPLIALTVLEKYKKKYPELNFKCVFVEEKKRVLQKLRQLTENSSISFKIVPDNFNNVCKSIITEIDGRPAFFFIDPDGIDLKKECLTGIVQRTGPTDMIINYIKNGVERISGLAKKEIAEISEKDLKKHVKTVDKLTDFYGLSIFENLNSSERERLQEWGSSIFNSGRSFVKEVAVFAMPYKDKAGNIYYLIFGSRVAIAKKIIIDIFKDSKKCDFRGQRTLDIFTEQDFRL